MSQLGSREAGAVGIALTNDRADDIEIRRGGLSYTADTLPARVAFTVETMPPPARAISS